MRRRNFIRNGVIGASVGLSGCIDPVNNILGEEDNQSEYPNYYEAIPTTNGEQGVFATHVDINSLKDRFEKPLEDPFSDLSNENESIEDITGSSLLSVQPTVQSAFQEEGIGSEVRSMVGLSDSDPVVEPEGFVILRGIIAFRGDFTEDYLTDEFGLEDSNGDGVYGESEALLSGDWVSFPFDGNAMDYTELIGSSDRIVDDNEDLLASEGIGSGDVNVVAVDTELDVAPFDFESMISSTTFSNDGYSTDTRIKLPDDTDTDSVNESVRGSVSYDGGSNILSIDSNNN